MRHRWQVHTYAAALILAGRHITEVQIDYIARDSGQEWLFSEPFSIELVREAMAWLKNVREAPIDLLPRDFRPGSPQCSSCPFFERCWEGCAIPDRDLRSALFVDEPDAAMWAEQLQQATERKRQAEKDFEDAKGALDALRPNDHGVAEVEVPGLDKLIRFSVSRPPVRMDTKQVRADYAAVGAEPPVAYGEPRISVTIAARAPE